MVNNQLTPTMINIVWSIIAALIVAIWYMLNSRINSKADQKDLNGFGARVSRLEEEKLSVDACDNRRATQDLRISSLDRRLSDYATQNSKEHAKLDTDIVAVHKGIQQTNNILNDMKDCITKLSVGKNCDKQ